METLTFAYPTYSYHVSGEIGQTQYGNEQIFGWFDMGLYKKTQEPRVKSIKIKNYPNSVCLSICGLQTPQGAAGPSGIEMNVEREQIPEMLRIWGEGGEIFPVMAQENESVSMNSNHELIRRNWSAKTLSPREAMELEGYTRELIEAPIFYSTMAPTLPFGPGIRAETTFPELGFVILKAYLGEEHCKYPDCWVADRQQSVLNSDRYCERRIIIPNSILTKSLGYHGDGYRSRDWEAGGTNISYAENTFRDPRHILYRE